MTFKLGLVAVVALGWAGSGVAHAGPATVNTFSGLYVGGVVSLSSNGPSATLFDDHTELLTAALDETGLLGVQAGYNLQLNSLVLGIEGDWSRSGNKASVSTREPDSVTAKLNSLASVRGRVGFVPVSNVLLFATAGVGWANGDFIYHDQDGGPTLERSGSATAPVYGGGVDLLLGRNAVFSAEYLHFNFDSSEFLANAVRGGDVSSQFGPADTFRFAISYKFDGMH